MTHDKDKEELEFLALLKGFVGDAKSVPVSDTEAKAALDRFLAREVALDPASGQFDFVTKHHHSIGQAVREYRTSRGLDPQTLAQRVGMTSAQLTHAEAIDDSSAAPAELLARLIGDATGVGTLKAMRLVKEVATASAAATANQSDPLLLAARKAPKK